MKSYNTKTGISILLKSLDDFKWLIKERHNAGYNRKESLQEFCLLGRFYSDSCGNFGIFSEDFVPKEKMPWIEDVLTKEELSEEVKLYSKYHPNKYGYNWGYSLKNLDIPDENCLCPICLKGWSLENIHDFHKLEDIFYHIDCFYLKAAEEEFVSFKEIFRKAGFKYTLFSVVENKYCNCSKIYDLPWYRVKTIYGDFEIGWRKNVISIKLLKEIEPDARLEDIYPNFEKIFKDEEVTKDLQYIHAWGWGKAQEYLHTLYKELSK